MKTCWIKETRQKSIILALCHLNKIQEQAKPTYGNRNWNKVYPGQEYWLEKGSKEHSGWWKFLYQGLINIFCKGMKSKYFRFCTVPVPTTQLCHCSLKLAIEKT